MYEVFVGGVRVGTVMKVMGEPPATRWQAYATRERLTDPPLRQGFATKKAASIWLEGQHAAALEKRGPKT